MKDTTKGYYAITLQSSIIGLSYMFVKIALQSTHPIDLLAHRFTIAAMAILIFRICKTNTISIKWRDVLNILPLSIMYPFLFFLFQTLGLDIVSSTAAGIIYAITPILTLIIANIILGESISPKQKALMSLSICGVIFINMMSGQDTGNSMYIGFLYIFLSAVSAALCTVFTRKLSKHYSTFILTYIMTLLGCISFNILSIIRHLLEGTISAYFDPFTNLSFVFPILYLGIASSLLTSLLSTYSLGKLEASTVGQFNNLSTVISILAGVLYLKELLYGYQYIGITAILIGTIGFSYLNKQKKM